MTLVIDSCSVRTHVYVGCLDKGSRWMNVIVEDDDADHHTQTKQDGFIAMETTAVLPERTQVHTHTHTDRC